MLAAGHPSRFLSCGPARRQAVVLNHRVIVLIKSMPSARRICRTSGTADATFAQAPGRRSADRPPAGHSLVNRRPAMVAPRGSTLSPRAAGHGEK